MDKEDILNLQSSFEQKNAEEILEWACTRFSEPEFAQSSGLGLEGQVLTDMLLKINPKATIFTLDTGRLNPETYDLMDQTMDRYHFTYDILFPDTAQVEHMVKEHGINLFYKSMDHRKKCCYIRKICPLKRKLSTLKLWICGLRKTQSVTRHEIKKLEWDDTNGLIKINPLADWSTEEVWDYIRAHGVPYNQLHDNGYPSIGCAPCTRPVQPYEDIRAGRWWWEPPDKKECGIHGHKENR
ncbi:MAG: phosphoadenylyl-sulfate reductase [Candidatus Omnitrophota bacterium]